MARTLIGTRIRERRRTQGRTQVSLARAIGISASYLNLIEHNKRGIAGKTLIALARELGMQPAELSDIGDEETITSLLETAQVQQTGPRAGVEMDRVEEFVGRYPGWAGLIRDLARQNRSQTERLHAMSDRLAQDPFLAETMHQVLSNITAIRSTADILSDGDVPPALQARFLRNLAAESERLSDGARAIVDHFDAADSPDGTSAPDPAAWPAPEDAAAQPGRQLSRMRRAAAEALATARRLMPEAALEQAARRLDFDPLQLAAHFGVEPRLILLRLADMPARDGFPVFGLIECDMSGAILLRKPLAALNPPQFSSACPLWPVYRAFSRPGQMLRAVLDMPSGDRVLSWAIARAGEAGSYDVPPMMRSTMAFSTAAAVFPSGEGALPTILGGLHCSVCPRKDCPERRTNYILA